MSVLGDGPGVSGATGGRRYRRRLFALVAFALLGLDQLAKWLIVTHYQPGQSYRLCSVLSITYNRNTGAAFGMWHGGGRALAAAAIVLIIVVLAWGTRYAAHNRLIGWGMAFLVGGALGNLVDRLRLGYVVDFVDLHFWPVFNLADVCVVIGAGLLMIYGLFGAPAGTTCTPPPDRPDETSQEDEA